MTKQYLRAFWLTQQGITDPPAAGTPISVETPVLTALLKERERLEATGEPPNSTRMMKLANLIKRVERSARQGDLFVA